MRPLGKLNLLHFYLQKTHGHPIRQGADLRREIFILKTSWRFDHVTVWKTPISTFTKFMVTKFWRVLTSGEGGVQNANAEILTDFLLRLRVTQKASKFPVLLSSFSWFSLVLQKWIGRSSFKNTSPCVTRCEQDQFCFLANILLVMCLL